MYKKKTLFIIGAGASDEVGMPIGSKLRDTIRRLSLVKDDDYHRKSIGDEFLRRVVRQKYQHAEEIEACFKAFELINTGIHHADSIDSFLESHIDKPMVTEMGKLLIVRSISLAEAKSQLFVPRDNIYNKLDTTEQKISDSWYPRFSRMLLKGTNLNNIEGIAEDVSFICFNYDRCLELFLIESISQRMGMAYKDAHSIVSKINIIHPYGHLGHLPNERIPNHASDEIPFGFEFNDQFSPWVAVEKIKTYTEQTIENSIVKKMHEKIIDAEQIIFLGFGFLPENMKLLSPPHPTQNVNWKRIYATGYGISNQEVNEIQRRIFTMCYGNKARDTSWKNFVYIECEAKCARLFELHSKNFSRD